MTVARARALRSNATEAERLLWRSLRQFKKAGIHFRRQPEIGPYYADFACHRAKLVVELDGSQHGEQDAVEYDSERMRFLRSRSYRVLRFWNGEVLSEPEAVTEFILAIAKSRMTLRPVQ